MSVTIYRDANFQGPFAHIKPGFFSGRDLVGYYNRSAYGSGEDLQRDISSIRVGPNTIVALYGGLSPSASAGARVIVGPYDVPDLGVLGMDDKTSAVQVLSFKAYDSGIPRSGGVTLYGGYQGGGRYAVLERGDYNAARLASEEVKFPANTLRSIRASPNVIAILYEGPDFDTTQNAIVVVGPTMINDLSSVGMDDRVASIRVVYTDPYDVPNRPSTQLGTTRSYFPGGSAGWPATRQPVPRAPTHTHTTAPAHTHATAPAHTHASAPAHTHASAPAHTHASAPAHTHASAPTHTHADVSTKPPVKSIRQLWVVIIILFVLVALLAAVIAAQSRYVAKHVDSFPSVMSRY